MSPDWKATQPKNDAGYLERMSKVIFSAGLNWSVVEKKWPNFKKAFAGFSPDKVAKLTENDVGRLVVDAGIVRNERKIRATVHNAAEVRKIHKEFGSFQNYLESFGKDEKRLVADLKGRFQHLGDSTSRTFLWSVAHPLKPNAEEKKWMAGHHMKGS